MNGIWPVSDERHVNYYYTSFDTSLILIILVALKLSEEICINLVCLYIIKNENVLRLYENMGNYIQLHIDVCCICSINGYWVISEQKKLNNGNIINILVSSQYIM